MGCVLRNFVPIDHLDRNHYDELLGEVADIWPDLVAELLLARLQRARKKESGYSAWGGLNLAEYVTELPKSPRFEELLRSARDFAVDDEETDYFARELFWAMAGSDPRADKLLSEWSTHVDINRRELAERWNTHRGYDPSRNFRARNRYDTGLDRAAR
jgi:hypothetical protein